MNDLTHAELRTLEAMTQRHLLAEVNARSADEVYEIRRRQHQMINEELAKWGHPGLPNLPVRPHPVRGISLRDVILGTVITVLVAVIAFSVWGWCT